ncbi:MAG: hypothetical protein R3C04_10500 [Hyphomonas sp.]
MAARAAPGILSGLCQTDIGTDESGALLDGDLRGRIADHKMYAKAFNLTVARQAEQAKAGRR